MTTKSTFAVNTGSDLNIVIIEDDQIFSTLLKSTLESKSGNINVDVFPRGLQATGYLKRNRPDLIVCDFGLEGSITGLQIWKFCRKKHPNVPFFIISGIGKENYDMLTSSLKNAPLFLGKDSSLNEIVSTIQKGLKYDEVA